MKSFQYLVKPEPFAMRTTYHKTKREAWSQIQRNVARFGAHMTTVKAVNSNNTLDVVYVATVGE